MEDHLNFIEEIVAKDIRENKHNGVVHTRFPPHPNGYLHIGHAKAITWNFDLAEKYNGRTNLRFDDTNPATESTEYVDSIKRDIRWLGFDWESREYYASDYFPILYEYAILLIEMGKAYVDESTPDEINEMKGTTTDPGTKSPYRDRPVDENLKLFREMKEGKHEEGSMVLRAKIDMEHPNMNMRDPLIYRIKKEEHIRTGDEWNIYPMYDFAHGQSDSIEGITHSFCSIEFENHRPLYNWFIETLDIFPSRQIEFARMNLSFTVLSKTKLSRLVKEDYVDGWDDPRMPTISGMRRRGYPPEAIREFCHRVGLSKRDNVIDMSLLEFCVRDHLNYVAPRRMVVLDPVKLVITNYPDDKVEWMEATNNPEDASAGTREIPFCNTLYIDRADFMEDPPKKFYRMAPGRDARLMNGYIVHCEGLDKDENGEISTIYATYYPDSRSGEDTSGIKPKATLHWVSARHAETAEVRMYDRLFMEPHPTGDKEVDYVDYFNEDSLNILNNAKIEPSLLNAETGDRFQFMRKGYYALDRDSAEDHKVFNRTVTMRDTWKKVMKQRKQQKKNG